jgi:hypothetical protein
MSRRTVQLVASMACALCLCGMAAASASAANIELHECTNSTLTPTQRFTTSGCSITSGSGTFGWRLIAGATSANVSTTTAASSIAATLGGISFKISCTGVTGGGTYENTGGKLVGSGIFLHYSGCAVSSPAGGKCSVNPLMSTNELKAVSNEMKVKYEAAKAEPILSVTVNGAECPAPLSGNKNLTGSATAVVEEMGRFEEFTAASGSALTFGGQGATYLGTYGLEGSTGAVFGLVT